ncbi:hypothetical protein ACV242_005504 [Peribacillus simplex]
MRYIYIGISIWDYSRYNVFKFTENMLDSLIVTKVFILLFWLTANKKMNH